MVGLLYIRAFSSCQDFVDFMYAVRQHFERRAGHQHEIISGVADKSGKLLRKDKCVVFLNEDDGVF